MKFITNLTKQVKKIIHNQNREYVQHPLSQDYYEEIYKQSLHLEQMEDWKRHANRAETLLMVGSVCLLSVFLVGIVLSLNGYFSLSDEHTDKYHNKTNVKEINEEEEKKDESGVMKDESKILSPQMSMSFAPFAQGTSDDLRTLNSRSVAIVRKEILTMKRRQRQKEYREKRRNPTHNVQSALDMIRVPPPPRPRLRTMSSRDPSLDGGLSLLTSPSVSENDDDSDDVVTASAPVKYVESRSPASSNFVFKGESIGGIQRLDPKEKQEDKLAQHILEDWQRNRNRFSKYTPSPKNIPTNHKVNPYNERSLSSGLSSITGTTSLLRSPSTISQKQAIPNQEPIETPIVSPLPSSNHPLVANFQPLQKTTDQSAIYSMETESKPCITSTGKDRNKTLSPRTIPTATTTPTDDSHTTKDTEAKRKRTKSGSGHSVTTTKSQPNHLSTTSKEPSMRRSRSWATPKESKNKQSGSNSLSSKSKQSTIKLSTQISKAHETIESLEKEKESLRTSIDGMHQQLEQLTQNHELLQDQMHEAIQNRIQIESTHEELIATKAQWRAMADQLNDITKQYHQQISNTQMQYEQESKKLQLDIQVWKNRCKDEYLPYANTNKAQYVNEDDDSAAVDATVINAKLQIKDFKIQDLESKLHSAEETRKELHNRIQELRGNIRVYVRVRPFVGNEMETEIVSSSSSSIASSSTTASKSLLNSPLSSIRISPNGEALSVVGGCTMNQVTNFSFDKIFEPCATQGDVFEEVSDFIQSALDGYHVCLFSYGQTGSGKTHTMQGNGTGEMRGIIPRAVEQILSQTISLRESQRWTFTITVSFLEIYNDELRDLLLPIGKKCKASTPSSKGSSPSSSFATPKTRNKGSSPKLSIKRNSKTKRSYVDGLTKVDIDGTDFSKGMDQLKSVMNTAAQERSVAATSMNAQSSRSHSVFILDIHGTNEDSGSMIHGSLNLCDLAGSERLKTIGSSYGSTSENNSRQKETKNINKSLSCLGDVFNALANKSSHVPYRNSKLTYLLQDSLSGDGKALMFVNLSPLKASVNESLCSLRFAQRASQIELGRASKHYIHV